MCRSAGERQHMLPDLPSDLTPEVTQPEWSTGTQEEGEYVEPYDIYSYDTNTDHIDEHTTDAVEGPHPPSVTSSWAYPQERPLTLKIVQLVRQGQDEHPNQETPVYITMLAQEYLQTLKETYAVIQGIDTDDHWFEFKDREIHDQDTAEKLNMTEGDTIICWPNVGFFKYVAD